MKIALAQINSTVGDFAHNMVKIREYALKAYNNGFGADLVVFPEMAITGYPCRDLVNDPEFVRQAMARTKELAETLPADLFVLVGTITEGHPKPHNSAVLIHNHQIEHVQNKTLLPTYDVFDEHRNFTSATEQRVITIKRKRIGISVCEDMWNNYKFLQAHKQESLYSTDPITNLIRGGAEIIINLSASPFHIGKHQTRLELLKDNARELDAIVWVNSVGGNDHLIFDGNSCVVTGNGDVVAQAHSFQEDLIMYDTEKQTGDICFHNPAQPMEELYEALTLGVRDYVRKCGFSKVVIGLSGGIDSALTAAIAVNALGKENVTGITMPSKYSSGGSVDDSLVLAKALGINMYRVPIQGMKDTVIGNMECGDKFEADKAVPDPEAKVWTGISDLKVKGLADENLQARIRGMILMTYSNQNGALVLSTGNKSELAVGYCTLYGDMCGGLAVISDVPKTMVYELCRWINKEYNREVIPWNTINKAPSAELAPDQFDQQSLPPYDILDAILEDYVENCKDALTISETREIDMAVVLKVINMIDRNEYKRQQATVGLKVSPKAFGVGRRFPIARKGMYCGISAVSVAK